MDLILAPAFTGVVLVQSHQIAIVALVQGLVLDSFEALLAELLQDDVEGGLGPDQLAGKGDIEAMPGAAEQLPGLAGLRLAFACEPHILPAGEQVFLVPFALAMADQH